MTEGELIEFRRVTAELAIRRCEALKLYQPLPLQEKFHSSMSLERVVRGSNRGGKTLAAAVEIARAVTNKDPHKKYPAKGTVYAVGYDGRHIAETIWKKLSAEGAFRIIRDKVTGDWRTFRPNDPEDAVRRVESIPSPPLIPERLIGQIAWEELRTKTPKVVNLLTGWSIYFFSGHARPPKGTAIDLAWFDEELEDGNWYSEIAARLVDNNGRFVWSATPQAGTDQLFTLSERALRESELPPEKRRCEEFFLTLDGNDHLTPLQKENLVDKLSEDERHIRVSGMFLQDKSKVYQEYSPIVHNIEWKAIPDTWTRYVSVDPGWHTCAALFAAVPPPGLPNGGSDEIWLYDELYIQNCDAATFGVAFSGKCEGQEFEAFIIDGHGGRLTDIGSGRTVVEQYTEQLDKYSLKSSQTGSQFAFGFDDIDSGIEACRSLLAVNQFGRARLRIMYDKVKNFVWEIRHYRYKRLRGSEGTVITRKTEERRRTHQMANFRYLAQYGMVHVPKRDTRSDHSVYSAFLRDMRKNRSGSMMLGPSS